MRRLECMVGYNVLVCVLLLNASVMLTDVQAQTPQKAQIAFHSNRDGNYDIYVMDVDGGNVWQLTDGGAGGPEWSPDGKQIAFSSDRDGNSEIYVMNADGGNLRRLTHNQVMDTYYAWRP